MEQTQNAAQEPQAVSDPLDVAADLVFRALAELPRALEATDFKASENVKLLLETARTVAAVDIAKSLRQVNVNLEALYTEMVEANGKRP